jgi:predicted esterase
MPPRPRLGSALALAALLTSGACRQTEAEKEKASATTPDAAVTAVKLAPLAAPRSSLMPVTGYAKAVLVSPVGATRPMPLVVAVLGIGDTPEDQCALWRELVAERAFVICPRFTPHFVPVQQEQPNGGQGLLAWLGLPGDFAPEPDPNASAVVQSGFRPTEVPEIEREIDTAIAALRAIFPKYVASGPAVYAGFSRGAFLGASLIAKNPSKYQRAIMIEGGQSAWTDATAAQFAKGGGKRVLFACGQPSCVAEAQPASQLLSRASVTTRIVHGEGEGHGYKGPVKEQIRAALSWVVEGDASWKN